MNDTTTQEDQADERQLVVFSLANESYGIDIGAVREIIRTQEITKVPRTPTYVRGVINLRGRVIPVVDLPARLSLPQTDATGDSRIVVVDINGIDIGVIVDQVTEVMRIKDDTIEPPSSVITTADLDYLTGIAKTDGAMIILLDLDRVLDEAASASVGHELAGAAS